VPSRSETGWRRHARRPAVIGATVLVVLSVGGATAWAAGGSSNSGYRMTAAARATVDKSLEVVGTIEPVNDASASFQVAGQVASVTATVGEQVVAGQALASLDPAALSESVSSAQSTLDSDDAQLTEDEDSQTSNSTATSTTAKAATTTTTTTTAASSPGGSSTGVGGTGTGTASTSVSQDQATVVGDQSKEPIDQQQETADLSEAKSVCEVSSSSGPPATTTTTSPTTGAGTSDTNACARALDLVSTDQQLVAKDQSTLSADEDTLAKALSSEASSTSPSSTSGTTSAPSQPGTSTPTSAASPAPSATSGVKSGTSGTVGSGSTASDSAEQIATDEAAIDTAKANLVEAQQSLDDAELSSPISGTIASVGVSVGDAVSADSSTEVIVIVGTKAYEATGTLSSTQVASVKVGYSAQVAVDGKTGTLAGTVAQVGPVQSSTSGYSYPVVVALPATATSLYSGSTANVAISTGQAKNALAVPSSAVIVQGTRAYVLTLSSGKLVETTIRTGIVGDTYIEVLSGLKEGERIVLADYSDAVPSSNTTTVSGFGGTGGFGGAGVGFSGTLPSGSASGLGGG
jgi:multidrug efflux pump subunit AcrA (membrane-fusion protein)